MVHRIGNTLLIDEFDVNKVLMAEAGDKLEWLKTFFISHIIESSELKVIVFNKS